MAQIPSNTIHPAQFGSMSRERPKNKKLRIIATVESAVTPPTHCSERDTGLRNFSYAIRYAPEAPVDGISSPSSDCWTMNRFKATGPTAYFGKSSSMMQSRNCLQAITGWAEESFAFLSLSIVFVWMRLSSTKTSSRSSGLSEDINWLVLLFRAAFTAAETSLGMTTLDNGSLTSKSFSNFSTIRSLTVLSRLLPAGVCAFSTTASASTSPPPKSVHFCLAALRVTRPSAMAVSWPWIWMAIFRCSGSGSDTCKSTSDPVSSHTADHAVAVQACPGMLASSCCNWTNSVQPSLKSDLTTSLHLAALASTPASNDPGRLRSEYTIVRTGETAGPSKSTSFPNASIASASRSTDKLGLNGQRSS
mmetsp:Transcript_45114/g.105440  ORF Transcript_45114/g.105440 Transcript_45114/m.105440 type:complete len:362 (+) Transcript_45114:1406-2491(+)